MTDSYESGLTKWFLRIAPAFGTLIFAAGHWSEGLTICMGCIVVGLVRDEVAARLESIERALRSGEAGPEYDATHDPAMPPRSGVGRPMPPG